MCGIAGIINKNASFVNSKDIKKMTDIISHRGPDGEGHFVYKNIALGHRRLAILDLSPSGHQPMVNDDYVLVFNGEIYNYIEIKEKLKNIGYVFNTNSDTEVALKAFQEWGDKCVEEFNGMWSFAIYDKKHNKTFISRDRFGIKPFYYFNDDKTFYFGSEIKQILTFVENPKVNRQVLYDFLYLSYQHYDENTFFENIKSLRAGHNLYYNHETNKIEIKKYYTLKKEDNTYNSLEESVESYKTKFNNSINLRLRSDVKVGTCLSGGLDSSYVAKTASEKYINEDKFTAITAKSIDAKNDESHYAKIVADVYNLNWKITEPSNTDFFNALDDIIYNQEEPFGSPSIIMQYFVMKKAKEEGCIVMLDGQGGDETLLGYERYYIPYLNSIKNPIKRISEFRKLSKNSKLSLKQLLSYYLYFGIPKLREYFLIKKNNYILDKNKKYFNKKLVSEFKKSSKDLFALQEKELLELQLEKLLKFEDRNSMAHSIEARVPFLDYKLVECALAIPAKFKIKDGWSKYILRKSYGENAPKEIVWRKNKFGFEAPSKKWMSDKSLFFKTIKQSEFLNHVIKKDSALDDLEENTLWKLFNIAKWAEKFNVSY
ncbi:asparagine synthase (glutamine-hydrolyzing) [Mesoflavibacter zeaxanthinifaciens]|uniref:asparagine synthase (glutamine-hydrolyzing) n=1 Tax=Mesoflavibacter zeaxanthinifaciens TaxID=393060 RepID=UPI0026EA7FEC|nr:asparagine synthase (glutamine-hydrolyzing) [Mesoflavibacter zeaxanthinifaciens]